MRSTGAIFPHPHQGHLIALGADSHPYLVIQRGLAQVFTPAPTGLDTIASEPWQPGTH